MSLLGQMNSIRKGLMLLDPSVASYLHLVTGNGHGSTNNKIRRFTTTQTRLGNGLTYVDDATDGGLVTVNRRGILIIAYGDSASAANLIWGVSKNSTQLTTAIQSITAANIVVFNQIVDATLTHASISCMTPVEAGDLIRAHTGGAANGTTLVQFQMFLLSF